MSGRATESPGIPTQGQAKFASTDSKTPTVGGFENYSYIATSDG